MIKCFVLYFCRFEVLQCGDVEKLIKKRTASDETPLYYVSIEETYDVIKRAHISTGHGGRDRMTKELNKKYVNVTREAIDLFKSLCFECQRKRKRPAVKGVVVKPILTNEFSSRGQVDLIDMQSLPQGQFKWIMVYQDHLTKFCILNALTSKRAAEVAHRLLDIFLLFGAPHILQSDNGSEFTAQIVEELKVIWPQLIIVHGKPRHPQSQGSVERANGDIKDMLCAWMHDNNTNDWSLGIKFVQLQKNTSHHAGINRAPYKALFGCDAKIGLTTSSLPAEIIAKLQTEDDLFNALSISEIAQQHDITALEPSDQTPPCTSSAAAMSPMAEAESLPNDQPTTSSSHQSPVSDTEDPNAAQDNVEMLLNQKMNAIKTERCNTRASQVRQAERMVKRSRIVLVAGQVEDNVAVPIPLVDRGRGDPRNILGIILDRDENDQYTIGVKCGILAGKFSRNQFDVCPQRLMSVSDIDRCKHVSIREAVHAESQGGGQGFTKCNCTGKKTVKAIVVSVSKGN